MNENLKKIAEQAFDRCGGFTINQGAIGEGHKNYREFVELFGNGIIEECARKVLWSKYTGTGASDYYDGFNEGLEYAADRMKELFGVK